MRRQMGVKSSFNNENTRTQPAIAQQLHHYQLSRGYTPTRIQALCVLRVHQ